MTIHTTALAKPPNKKLDSIFDKLAIMKASYADIKPQTKGIVLLELSTGTVDLITFLSSYAGDQDLITYANQVAVNNPVYATQALDTVKYPSGYDVQVDFALLVGALMGIKAALSALDFTNAVSINVDGKHEWVDMDATTIITAISAYTAVVV